MKVVIMAGGSGTRLWPLSRKLYPKQFLKFENFSKEPKSLFQESFERALKLAKLEDIVVVTNKDHKFLVMGELEELNQKYPEENIIVEPSGKGTLPAVLLAIRDFKEEDTFIVLASDHHIKDDSDLIKSKDKIKELSKNNIVIFGIKPNEPHTGYGYIKYDKENNVEEFKEKPDKEKAKELIEEGCVWNSGMLASTRGFFEEQTKEFAQDYLDVLYKDKEETYNKIKEQSFDYGILEKSKNLKILIPEIYWTDLGSFDSIYDNSQRDENGNVKTKETILYDSKNNLIQGFEGKKIVLSGINDALVIDTVDALLICKKNTSQNVKKVVNDLKEEKSELLQVHKTAYRPWGSYTVLENGKNYKTKRLTIYPNKKLSLQLHNKRSEHWVVIKGTATVVKGEEEFDVKSNESVYIPIGTKHRIANKTNENVEIIEVQTGNYLEEDDIVRFEDDFGRHK